MLEARGLVVRVEIRGRFVQRALTASSHFAVERVCHLAARSVFVNMNWTR